eukprot:7670180-Karenia_brevis.AAC.1
MTEELSDSSRSDTVSVSEDSEFERHEKSVKQFGLQTSKGVSQLRDRFWAAKKKIKLADSAKMVTVPKPKPHDQRPKYTVEIFC